MAITPTIGGNITFGKGRLENKPVGSVYNDMLYFATDENTIFLGNTKVSSGLLDVEYKSVLSDNGEAIDLTNYPGLQATESGPIRIVGNNTILDKGSYILFKKMEYNNVQLKWEAKWHLIVLSSSVTPEALQTEINAIAGDVEQAQDDIEDLQNDVSVLDASLKETDQKVDDLTEKVETVVIPDVSGLHEDVSALQEFVQPLLVNLTPDYSYGYNNFYTIDKDINEIDNAFKSGRTVLLERNNSEPVQLICNTITSDSGYYDEWVGISNIKASPEGGLIGTIYKVLPGSGGGGSPIIPPHVSTFNINLQEKITPDSSVIQDSSNLVTSRGIYTALQDLSTSFSENVEDRLEDLRSDVSSAIESSQNVFIVPVMHTGQDYSTSVKMSEITKAWALGKVIVYCLNQSSSIVGEHRQFAGADYFMDGYTGGFVGYDAERHYKIVHTYDTRMGDDTTGSITITYIGDISQTVTDLCTNLAAVDDKVETLETILDTNSTTTSTRLNNIEANYVKTVSAANASPIRVTTESSTNGKDVTIDISLGSGLKIQDGSVGIDTTADVFNGLGSYKIVKVDEAGLQYKLQKAGSDIADSAVINIPKDQFLKDVSIVDGTGANQGKKVIRFAWQLTDEKQPLHSEVLLTDIFPGIEGKTNEVSVTTNQTTGKLEVALDSSVLNKIAELDSDLDSLDQQIYTYVGSTTDNVVVSVDSSSNDTKVISAHLQWINFDGE